MKALGGGVGCCVIVLGGLGLLFGYGVGAIVVIGFGCALVMVSML